MFGGINLRHVVASVFELNNTAAHRALLPPALLFNGLQHIHDRISWARAAMIFILLSSISILSINVLEMRHPSRNGDMQRLTLQSEQVQDLHFGQ